MSQDEKKRPSRRDFLKTGAVGLAGAGLALGEQPGAEAASLLEVGEGAPQATVDVAIVGAGVAGCYAAYRLATAKAGDFKPGSPIGELFKKNGGKLKIGLFESSGRVGGRLLSPYVEGVPSYTSEFGGFRFNRHMHIVWDTAKHLGLSDEVFHFDDQPAQGQNVVYLRGKRLTREQVNRGKGLPYNLAPDEKGMSPDELETLAANRTFAGSLPDVPITRGNPPKGFSVPLPAPPNGFSALRQAYQQAFFSKDWKTVKKASDRFQKAKETARPGGRPLEQWTWWALKRHFLSQEAVAAIEDAGGYDSTGTTGNVGSNNLYEDFYFPDTTGPLSSVETRWRHIVGGYSQIPAKLQEGFAGTGGTTYRGYQLARFDNVEGTPGEYDLLFYKRNEGPGVAKDGVEAEHAIAQEPDRGFRVRASHVVLAIPRRGLQLLDQNTSYFLNDDVQTLINSAGPVPAIRMFLSYDEPWWHNVYKTPANGRSTTDLGVRQFYYWQTEKDGKALVLATYSNGQSEAYWRGIQDGQPYDVLTGAVGTQVPVAPQKGGPRHSSVTMAEEAHRQLMTAIGVKDAPRPYYAHFQNWTKDPWGAGWHYFNTGVNQNEVIPKIRQPLLDENVYIVGESFSNVQGWVQGALNSTEAMLQCNLGLNWPSFVRRHGTWLGPGTKWLIGGQTDPCLEETYTNS